MGFPESLIFSLKSPRIDTAGEIHICLQNGERRSGGAEGEQSYRWFCQVNWTIYFQMLSSPAVSELGDLGGKESDGAVVIEELRSQFLFLGLSDYPVEMLWK